VHTITADKQKRIRIPTASPGQVFAFEDHGDGSITLTVVHADRKQRFPKGSLVKHVADWNKEFAPVAKKMKVPVPTDA
jgi:hypothetical protein